MTRRRTDPPNDIFVHRMAEVMADLSGAGKYRCPECDGFGYWEYVKVGLVGGAYPRTERGPCPNECEAGWIEANDNPMPVDRLRHMNAQRRDATKGD